MIALVDPSFSALTVGDYVRLIPVGVVVLVLGAALWRLRRRQAGRRILQFDRSKELDVVLTTSGSAAPIEGIPAQRFLTGYGQVRGAASCTRALSKLYPRKLISLHLSKVIHAALDGDLLLLGGPLRNEQSREFIEELRQRYDILFDFDDLGRKLHISVPGRRPFDLDEYTPRMAPRREGDASAFPAEDIGIIVLSRRIGHKGHEFRSIMCAGFTTYGTAAAAEFLFGRLARMSRFRARRQAKVPMFARRYDMVIIVKAVICRGEVAEIEFIRNVPLGPRGARAPSSA